MTNSDQIHLVRDMNCPKCNWPETFTLAKMINDDMVPVEDFCKQCDWSETKTNFGGTILY